MEVCPNCNENNLYKKVLTCKFCNKFFCSITCLMQHSAFHSKTYSPNTIINSLKKKQSKNETQQYSFITPGIFTDNYIYDKKYDISNFSKVVEGFIPYELGRGSFGCVYLVTHNTTKKKYALKVMNKHKLLQTYGSCQLVYNEIEIHSKLNHPNIIRLYNVLENEEEISILLEYAENGSLYSLIQDENGFSEHKAYKYFIQIVNAVYFLHQNNIIHRDIKPENILIGENDLLKLCDFGWAKELTVNNRSTFCGTVEYMAPEIVGSEKYDCSVDVWSLGILLYELLMGHSPFKSKKAKNSMINIKKHDLVFRKDKKLSKDCINLIKGLLEVNPLNRLKLKDIFEHPFILTNSKLEKKEKKVNFDLNDKILNKKTSNSNFTEELKKKFGFDSQINLRSKLSSKEIVMEFLSDKNLINVKKCDNPKIERRESKRLEKLIGNMSNELEKAKKKVDNLKIRKSEQFSFEDFRDSKMLYSDKVNKIYSDTINETREDSNLKETQNSTNFQNTTFEDDDEDEKENTFDNVDVDEEIL